VKIYEAAVSTEEGFTTFFFDAQNPGSAVETVATLPRSNWRSSGKEPLGGCPESNIHHLSQNYIGVTTWELPRQFSLCFPLSIYLAISSFWSFVCFSYKFTGALLQAT
jgi:hypothetical protein